MAGIDLRSPAGAGSGASSGLTPTAVKTAAYTAAAGDLVRVDSSGGTVSVTLPASATAGASVTVKKVDSSAKPVKVLPSGTDTIDGLSSVAWNTQYQSRKFVSNGSGIWVVEGGLTPTTNLPVIAPGVWSPRGALDSYKTARDAGGLCEINVFGDSLTFGQTASGSNLLSQNNYSPVQKLRALFLADGYGDGGVGIRGYYDSASMNPTENLDAIQAFSRTDSGCGVTSGSNVVTDTAILATDIGRKVTPGAGFGANGFVGSVTPGTSFTVVTAQGGATALNATSTTTANMTLSGDGFAGTAGFYGPLHAYTPTAPNATQTGFTTVFQGKGTTVRIGYVTQSSGAATFTYSVDGGTAVTVNTSTGTRTVAYATVSGLTAGTTHTVTITVTVAGTLEVWPEWVNGSGIVIHKQGMPGQQLASRLPYASNNSQQTAWMMGLGVGTSYNTEANLYPANTGPRSVKLNILFEGVNDQAAVANQTDAIARAQAAESAIGIFAELCRNAATPGIVCLPQFAYFTNGRSYMGLFRTALKTAAEAYSLPWIDLGYPVGPITSAATYGMSFNAASVHPNAAGADAQAQFLYDKLLGPNALV